MNLMQYKGYSARVEYSAADGCFVGRVLGIRDIIGFHGESVGELEGDFHGAVDFYLDSCARRGKDPEKPYAEDPLLEPVPQGLLSDIIADAVHAALEMARAAPARKSVATKKRAGKNGPKGGGKKTGQCKVKA